VRRAHVTAIAIVATLVVVLVGGAWVYDRGRQDTIASGVKVGGVEVGGLTPEQARSRLQRRLLAPLQEPVVVERGTRSWRLTAKEARIIADVQGSVDAAMARGRDGSFLTRSWRELTGGSVAADLQPELAYDDRAVVRLIDRVRRVVDRPAKDATVTFTASSVAPVAAQSGRRLKASRLHRDIRAAIVVPGADRTFVAHARSVKPKVTTAELGQKYPTLVTVNRGGFKLTLYKNLKRVKTYPIAVGRIGLETPAGLYAIQDKQVDPAWHVPDSDWAGDLAGQVIPGGIPENPLKARWMGIYNGAGIHGTDDTGSLGSAASHGCVRMAVPDVIDLYDRVEVGTPIYIG
jgi:lipoprotein-anchoring transpeptidase ErfK/SrfK